MNGRSSEKGTSELIDRHRAGLDHTESSKLAFLDEICKASYSNQSLPHQFDLCLLFHASGLVSGEVCSSGLLVRRIHLLLFKARSV